MNSNFQVQELKQQIKKLEDQLEHERKERENLKLWVQNVIGTNHWTHYIFLHAVFHMWSVYVMRVGMFT